MSGKKAVQEVAPSEFAVLSRSVWFAEMRPEGLPCNSHAREGVGRSHDWMLRPLGPAPLAGAFTSLCSVSHLRRSFVL